MSPFPYALTDERRPAMGLIVLQSDLTVEDEIRRLVPAETNLLVSRVPSAPTVTRETLAAMEGALTGAAALFPEGHRFDAVGYACTSGTAQIGADRVAERVRAGTEADAVTNPLSALVAACAALGVRRLALLSPYVEAVSERLRAVLADAGVETPLFGTFAEPAEATVARIDGPSIVAAARSTMADGGAEALFLSCTNLRTLGVIAPLEAELGLPVLSSNLVLAWHMDRLSRGSAGPATPRALLGRQSAA